MNKSIILTAAALMSVATPAALAGDVEWITINVDGVDSKKSCHSKAKLACQPFFPGDNFYEERFRPGFDAQKMLVVFPEINNYLDNGIVQDFIVVNLSSYSG